jgi:hypothetical protein
VTLRAFPKHSSARLAKYSLDTRNSAALERSLARDSAPTIDTQAG